MGGARARHTRLARLAIGLVAAAAPIAACGAPGNARPASALEASYRALAARDGGDPRVATAIYRDVLSRALYSDCAMVPRDSEAFNQRLRRCGPVRAVVISTSRLLLEVAARPAYLSPVQLGGRVRWIDRPTSCAPL
jgi:hypothetical protein